MNTKNAYAWNSQKSTSRGNPSHRNASKEWQTCLQGPKVLKIYPRRMQCARPWRVFMAERGRLTGEFPGEEGEAVPQRGRRGGSGFCSGEAMLRRMMLVRGRGGACSSCKREARRQWSGEEEGASPAPLFIRGRGNCAGYHAARIACLVVSLWPSCGLASAHVCRARICRRIFCAARARDLRRQRGSGWERSLPRGSGHGAES